uniref:PPARGC1 and ESRR induced regulator, muscle 1 n=1 Tax=Molossus molossus TaxID=27622 RepID=A0A7J8B7S7_MOLMO|nr:PPARGC1 and ESRR induced regulator, muscle 1 [Molossus molossus]
MAPEPRPRPVTGPAPGLRTPWAPSHRPPERRLRNRGSVSQRQLAPGLTRLCRTGPVSRAGELRGPLTPFTFSQNDMCLVFVAFATWAVRTSDLHAPDAWKTVLLANIGTISAIRYFRRQVWRERRSPSPSPSPSPGPSS